MDSYVAFGAGRTLQLCMKHTDTVPVAIYDSDDRLWGKTHLGPVIQPGFELTLEDLAAENVVVFSAQYWDIASALRARGFVEGFNLFQFTDLADCWKLLPNIPTDFWFRNLHKIIDEGQVVVDVGSNVGIWTIEMAKRVGATGRVIAFEPLPENFQQLTKHLRYFELPQVTAINMALCGGIETIELEMIIPERLGIAKGGSAHFSHVKLTTTTKEASWSSDLGPTWKTEDFDVGLRRTVSAIALDTVADTAAPGNIDFIKIDVEGAEMEVLEGSRKTLEASAPGLLIESGVGITSHKELTEYLGELGYTEISPSDLADNPANFQSSHTIGPNHLFWSKERRLS